MAQLHQRVRRQDTLKCESKKILFTKRYMFSAKGIKHPVSFCRSRAISYRNALFRKGLEVLSSEGIRGNDAKKLVNEAFNDNQQSYRQLSRSAGRLLNLIKQLLLTVKQMKAHPIISTILAKIGGFAAIFARSGSHQVVA